MNLPKEVQYAWEAYQEMGVSKAAYFDLLQNLDLKYREGGTPTIAENLQLEKLLKVHDQKVTAFNESLSKVVNKDARELLLKKLSSDSGQGSM